MRACDRLESYDLPNLLAKLFLYVQIHVQVLSAVKSRIKDNLNPLEQVCFTKNPEMY